MRLVNRALDQLVDAPLAQVPQLLDQLCPDPAVRSAVERALEHLHAGEGFLDSPVVLTPPNAPTQELYSGIAPGTRIGRYELVAMIGEGGMGAVYEASQENPKRRVALKVMRSAAFSSGAMRRFERESAVLGMLHHPCIAQVYEAGVETTALGPVPYFAMELVRGPMLDAYVRETRPENELVLELMARVSDAVHHAHTHGVIHRDLKPANILVQTERQSNSASGDGGAVAQAPKSGTEYGGGPMPKVLDFGVARVIDAGRNITMTHHTGDGQLVGTLTYMSPEQVRISPAPGGVPSTIGPRSDVYALGAILYELLAGKPALDVRGLTVTQATRIIEEKEPEPLRSAAPRVHDDVATIVATAMAKDPRRRYSSAAELAMDLRRFLRKEPISARPATTMYQLRRFAARNRGLVTGVVAAVLALTSGLFGTLIFAKRAYEARNLATLRAEEAERNGYISALRGAQAAVLGGDAILARASLDVAPKHLRGWEWEHLDWSLSRGATLIAPPLEGRGGLAVTSTGVIHAERDIYETSFDGTSTRVLVTRSNGAKIRVVHASASAKYLVALTYADDIELYDLTTAQLVRTYKRQKNWVRFLDDRPLLSGDGLRELNEVRDVFTGELIGHQHGQSPWVKVVPEARASIGAPVLGSDFYDVRCVRHMVDEVPPRETQVDTKLNPYFEIAVVVSPRSVILDFVESRTGKRLGSADIRAGARGASFRPGVAEVAIGSLSGALEIWDLTSFRVRTSIPTHGPPVAVMYSPDGSRLVLLESDGSIRCFNADLSDTPVQITDGTVLAISPDGESMVTRGWGTIRQLHTQTGELLWTRFLTHIYVNAAAYSRDGSILAAAPVDRVVTMEAATGRVLTTSQKFPHRVLYTLEFAPDGSSVYAGGLNGEVFVVRKADGFSRVELVDTHHQSPITALALSPDGRWLASGSGEGKMLRDLNPVAGRGDAGLWIRDLQRPGLAAVKVTDMSGRVGAIAFDESSRVMYAVDLGGNVLEWDCEKGIKLSSAVIPGGVLSAVAPAPHGDGLLIGDAFGSLNIFRPDRGEILPLGRQRNVGGGEIRCMVTNPGKTTVVAGSTLGAFLYETRYDDAVLAARQRYRRAFTLFAGADDRLVVADRVSAMRKARPGLMRETDVELAEEMLRIEGTVPNSVANRAFFLCVDGPRAGVSTRGDLETAVKLASAAVEAAPEVSYFQDIYALALVRTGQYERALEVAAVSERIGDPTRPSAFGQFVRALALVGVKEYPAARQSQNAARAMMTAPYNAAFAANEFLDQEVTEKLRDARPLEAGNP